MVLRKNSLHDMDMLRQRIITALFLGIGILAAILFLPNAWLAFVFALVTLVAAWEWAGLLSLPGRVWKVMYVGLVAVSLMAAWMWIRPGHAQVLFLVAVLWWAGAVVMLAAYDPRWLDTVWLQWLMGLSGFVVLVPAWLSLALLHQRHPAMLVFLLLLVCVSDISAYFAGKRFGKSKLAPSLSPGKSREGLWSALVASLVLAVPGMIAIGLDLALWFYFLCLCLITVLVATVGDLFESLLKRRAGVKDSSRILPGHGGVLDRVDSLTAAAPGFVFGVYWVYGYTAS